MTYKLAFGKYAMKKWRKLAQFLDNPYRRAVRQDSRFQFLQEPATSVAARPLQEAACGRTEQAFFSRSHARAW